MNKLVINTQYLENYGDSKDPYMKFKGGTTYVMSNCGELNENEIATLVARVKPYITTDLVKSNGGSEEYVNSVKVVPHTEQVCADWDSVTEFSFDLFVNIYWMVNFSKKIQFCLKNFSLFGSFFNKQYSFFLNSFFP